MAARTPATRSSWTPSRLPSARERDFSALLQRTRERLAAALSRRLAAGAMRVAKQRLFGQLKFEYSQLRAGWGGFAGYDAWFARTLNNAHLAAVATYDDCVPGLVRELARGGFDRGLRAPRARAEPAADRRAPGGRLRARLRVSAVQT